MFLYGQANNQPDYNEIFGEQYIEAQRYLNENQWITTTLVRHKINPCFAQSIIYPELIRYSCIKDKIEIQALKTLYVQYGEKYADFSVGRFQIKPSFAEKLETDMKKHTIFHSENELQKIDTVQSVKARLERIKRLESATWQLQYLMWFIMLSQERFNLATMPDWEKLKFVATAYNCGYNKPAKQIIEISKHNYFHTGIFSGKDFYNYSDISLFYWRNCSHPSK